MIRDTFTFIPNSESNTSSGLRRDRKVLYLNYYDYDEISNPMLRYP